MPDETPYPANPRTRRGEIICGSCGASDQFAAHADGVLLTVEVNKFGQIDFALDELPIDVTLECVCGARAEAMQGAPGYAWSIKKDNA
jgi:hypothetical protein